MTDTIAMTVLWAQLDDHCEFVAAWPAAAEEWDPEGIKELRARSEQGFERLTETGGWRFFTSCVSIDVPDEEV